MTTVAYQVKRLEVPERRSTGAGKRRAVVPTASCDGDDRLLSLGTSDASDNDSLDGFISDDGSDWRGQVAEGARQRARRSEQHITDMHYARIEAGLDPSADADDASEDDIDMYKTPARRCHFVDDEAGDEDDAC